MRMNRGTLIWQDTERLMVYLVRQNKEVFFDCYTYDETIREYVLVSKNNPLHSEIAQLAFEDIVCTRPK